MEGCEVSRMEQDRIRQSWGSIFLRLGLSTKTGSKTPRQFVVEGNPGVFELGTKSGLWES